MKQPMLPVALAYVAGVVVGAWYAPPLMAGFVVAFALLTAAFVLPGWRPWLLWPLVIVTGCLSLTLRTAVLAPHDLRLVAGEAPQIATVRGTVTGEPSVREPSDQRAGEPHTLAVVSVEELQIAGDELAGERGFEGALEEALQRTRAIDRVVAFAGEVFFSGVSQIERDVAIGQAGAQERELEVHDLLDVGQRERLEEDRVVHAIQEFGTEVQPELAFTP